MKAKGKAEMKVENKF